MLIPIGTIPAAKQNSRTGWPVICEITVPDSVNTSDIAAITASIPVFATSVPESTKGFMRRFSFQK